MPKIKDVLNMTSLAALSLEPDAECTEHPRHTRAAHAKFLKDDPYYAKQYADYEEWLKNWHGVSIPAPRDHFTSRQIEAIAGMVAEELRARGYDNIGDWTFTMLPEGYELSVPARDTWQENVPYEYRSHNDGFSCEFRKLDEIWEALRAVPSRERRELEVLLRQTNSFSEMAKEIQGQAARAFAKELIALAAKHQNLLTKAR